MWEKEQETKKETEAGSKWNSQLAETKWNASEEKTEGWSSQSPRVELYTVYVAKSEFMRVCGPSP